MRRRHQPRHARPRARVWCNLHRRLTRAGQHAYRARPAAGAMWCRHLLGQRAAARAAVAVAAAGARLAAARQSAPDPRARIAARMALVGQLARS